MGAVAKKLHDLWLRVTHDKPLPEPENLYPERPMTSFFGSLSEEQKARLRAYRGPENHGEEPFRI